MGRPGAPGRRPGESLPVGSKATRIRSAFRVTVKVHETMGGKQLDLGAFQRNLPVAVSGDGEELTVATPSVRGIVRSTFVIDEKGQLAREWRGVKVPGHVEEVLNFVKAL